MSEAPVSKRAWSGSGLGLELGIWIGLGIGFGLGLGLGLGVRLGLGFGLRLGVRLGLGRGRDRDTGTMRSPKRQSSAASELCDGARLEPCRVTWLGVRVRGWVRG